MAAKKPTRYRGLLAQPIVVTHETTDDEFVSAVHARWTELHRHYRIVPKTKGAIKQLLRALAYRHVPGFRIVFRQSPVAAINSRGKPAAVNHAGRVRLQIELDALTVESVKKPERSLHTDPVLGGVKPATLRRTYYRDRKKFKDPIVGITMEFVSKVQSDGLSTPQTAFDPTGAPNKFVRKRSAKKSD